MPYSTLEDLPDEVRELSAEHQAQWLATFNAVFAETGSEEMAAAAAWGAVRKGFARASLKAAPDGTPIVAGWGMLFTGPEELDLEDTYFDEATQTLLDYYPAAPLWMEHGQDPKYGADPIGQRDHAQVFRHGIWVEHRLHTDHPHLDLTVKDVGDGRLSYSSDSIGHYVVEGFDMSDGRLGIWPIAGWSLTKSPAEPALGPVSLKSFTEALTAAQAARGSGDTDTPEAQAARGASSETETEEIAEDVRQMNREQLLQALKSFLGLKEDTSEEEVLAGIDDLVESLSADGGETGAEGEGNSQANETGGDDDDTTDPAISDETVQALARTLALDEGAGRAEVAEALKTVAGLLSDDEPEAPEPRPLNLEALGQAAAAARSAQPRTPYMVSAPANTTGVSGGNGSRNPVTRRSHAARRFNLNRGVEATPLVDMLVAHLAGSPVKAAKAVGSAGPSGGYLLNRILSDEIFEPLYAEEVVMAAGARVERFPGSESMTFRKMHAGAAAYWAGAGQPVGEGQPTWGLVHIQPKELVARTLIHNKTLRNADARLESQIRRDIMMAIALEIDRALLFGTGGRPAETGHSGVEPLGLIHIPGVSLQALGSGNGASPKFKDIEDSIGRLEDADVRETPSWGWVFHPRSKRTFTNMKDQGGQYVLRRSYAEGELPEILGYAYHTTTQIPKNVTVGTSSDCSYIILGRWEDFVVGLSLDLEVTVDTSRYVNERQTLIQAVTYVDGGVFYPQAFDVLTGVRP